jgi:hypothetical protein
MTVTKRLRYEILRRDNHACRYCGGSAPELHLTVDHVIPTALGGSDEPSNLVTACRDCNAGKSSSSPDAAIVEDVDQDALRWSRAMTRAAEMQTYDLEELNDLCSTVADLWCQWKFPNGDSLPMPSGWQISVEILLRHRIDDQEWDYAIRHAMTNRKVGNDGKWKYACGILWRRLEQRVQQARELLATDDTDGEPF